MSIEQTGINVIRGLAMDAPNAAKSGHQGTAMALAPLAHVLWTRIMRYDARDPSWPNRDRFILSAGHASILQYIMLYLTGFGVELEDLRNFRQWGSSTPGHPEVGQTKGVEVTTGPLGQGLANAVGMAIAEAHLRSRFGSHMYDHHVFVIASDGDLQEGISHEAASLAGHFKLGKLVVCYDDNGITIDGDTQLSMSDDTVARFKAYNWHVEDIGAVTDDIDAIEAGLRRAMAVEDKPSLLVIRSTIGFPAPKSAGTPAAHGYAIRDDEIAATKAAMGIPSCESFYVPDDVLSYYRKIGIKGGEHKKAWELNSRNTSHKDGDTNNTETWPSETWPSDFTPKWADFTAECFTPEWAVGEQIATRKASHATLSAIAPYIPSIVTGSADLTESNGTSATPTSVFSASNLSGRQIHFGVREHAMGAIANGLALHGTILPVVGTFLVFSDYMKPAVRLAALSKAKVIFVWTHDSVCVGEDGPTHQPIEHLASLRAIPGIQVIRPADANETVGAWYCAINSDIPTALILTRQAVPVLPNTSSESVRDGAYVVLEPQDEARVTLVGTGSEVFICSEAAATLHTQHAISARVVSMPSWEIFAQHDQQKINKVIQPDIPSLAVEAGSTLGWHQWVDEVIGIDSFGSSAPGAIVLKNLGISPDAVVAKVVEMLLN